MRANHEVNIAQNALVCLLLYLLTYCVIGCLVPLVPTNIRGVHALI